MITTLIILIVIIGAAAADIALQPQQAPLVGGG